MLSEPNSPSLSGIIAAYLEAVDRGEHPDRDELLRQNPAIADELRSFFATEGGLEKVGQALQREQLPDGTAAGTIRYFGDYELLGEIARGGMGVVYRARQVSLNRPVALKMILQGQLAGERDVRRFRDEAEAAANLDHPNIVPIYEVGEHLGQHYFSMKLIEGINLAEEISTRRTPRQCAQLVATVARAVHHAHQRGILHRDLKPGNILIDAEGRPHVTDFGLARRLGVEKGQTQSGALVGTPEYMAPEQARAQKDLTTGVDVYGLGAVLHVLLTGKPPFQGDNLVDLLKQVIERDPLSPRVLNPGTPLDLEKVCLKCLAKDPSGRYATVAELADDLDRFVAGEPVQARSAGRAERVWRWCRRNPVVAGLTGAVAALLLAVAGVAAALAIQAERRADAEERERRGAEQTVEATNALLSEVKAKRQLAEDRLTTIQKILWTAQLLRVETTYQQQPRHALELLHDPQACPIGLRDAVWRFYDSYCQRGRLHWHNSEVKSVAFSPDGKTLATAGWDTAALLWDVGTGRAVSGFYGHKGGVWSVAFSSDGKILATGSEDRTVKLWDVASGKELATLKGHTRVVSIVFSPDCKTLASASGDGTVQLWDVGNGQVRSNLRGHTVQVSSLAFSPDGKSLASGGGDPNGPGEVRLWDASTGKEQKTLKGHARVVYCVAFSPDGRTLASGGFDYTVKLWDVATGKERATPLRGHTDNVMAVAFNPDGRTLASAGSDRDVKLWDVAGGQALATYQGHTDSVLSLAFSPDGKTLASGSGDRTAKLWDMAPEQARATLRGHTGEVRAVAYSLDGKTLASGGKDRTIRLWDVATGQVRATLKGHTGTVLGVAYSPDGKTLASAGEDGMVGLWDVATGRASFLRGHSGPVNCVAYSPDGKTVASGGQDAMVHLWDVATGQARPGQVERPTQDHPFFNAVGPVYSVAFSPDGKTLASGDMIGLVRLGDVASGELIAAVRGQSIDIKTLAFSPDGKTLASGSSFRVLELWDVGTREVRSTLGGRADHCVSVAFSTDGKTLASASQDGTLRLWDVGTGEVRTTLRGHAGEVWAVAFSPDGKSLASASQDQAVKLWDVAGGRARVILQGHTGEVWSAVFSPDGKIVGSGGVDKTVRLWDVASGEALATLRGHTDPVESVAYSPDGKTLASAGHDKTVRLWDVASGKELATLQGHAGRVGFVAFSKNGKRLVSRDDLNRTLVWDVQSGQQVDEAPPPTTAPGRVSPDGKYDALIQSHLIHLVDRHWKPHLPPLFKPDPHWHRKQRAVAEKEQPFAAAFHQSRLAGFEPWDATLRWKEAEAWTKAGQEARAARAFVQAILLDPASRGHAVEVTRLGTIRSSTLRAPARPSEALSSEAAAS